VRPSTTTNTGTDSIVATHAFSPATTCSQYDEVAGDMGGEQPAKPDELDGVRASGDQAEKSGQQHRAW